MSYDIGIGVCDRIDGDMVVVLLDSSIVDKLVPNQPWRRSGTSQMRLPGILCSSKRPPEPGAEVYLDRDALSKPAKVLLELAGSSASVPIDLRLLLQGLDPQPAHPPAAKGRSSR